MTHDWPSHYRMSEPCDYTWLGLEEADARALGHDTPYGRCCC